MDNQQPRLEQSKVQRLSRQGVLKNSYVFWEVPPSNNYKYVYVLVSSENNNLYRYVGITSDPKRRLSHHLGKNSLSEKCYKSNWIKSCYKKGFVVNMKVLYKFKTYKEATKKEEFLINSLKKLTNIDKKPTKPHSINCYIYDIHKDKVFKFDSLQEASVYVGKSPIVTRKLKGIKCNFIYSDKLKTKKEFLQKHAKIKAKNIKTNEILYFISNSHAAYYFNVIPNSINLAILKYTKSIKGYQIVKINEKFTEYKNKRINKIKCLEDNKIFNNAKIAGDYYNIDSSSILKVCKKKRKTCGGRRFCYLK